MREDFDRWLEDNGMADTPEMIRRLLWDVWEAAYRKALEDVNADYRMHDEGGD